MKLRFNIDDIKNAKKMMDILFLQIAKSDADSKEHNDMATGILTSSLILSELMEARKIELDENGEYICSFNEEE